MVWARAVDASVTGVTRLESADNISHLDGEVQIVGDHAQYASFRRSTCSQKKRALISMSYTAYNKESMAMIYDVCMRCNLPSHPPVV